MSVPLLFLAAVLASGAAAKVSVEGCVATGAEVGRKADLRERTGLDEHFVLVGAKVIKGKGPVAASGPAVAPGPMYKISGLTDEQMKLHVGYRVRVEGSFGDLEQPSASTGTPQDNLIELNVATIRQVPGACALPKS
jgi:hypothetical protein